MSQLPRLPVPDIRRTLDGYLRAVQPVLLADEHSGGTPFAVAYARQRALVNAFLDGPARRAQARLRTLDSVSPHNWLDDNFWVKKAYLEWRAPLLVNSNWWLAFVNDPGVPPKVVTHHAEGITPWQVRRAACLVHGILDFKHRMHACVSPPFPSSLAHVRGPARTSIPTPPGQVLLRLSSSPLLIQSPRSVAETLHFPNIQPLPSPATSFRHPHRTCASLFTLGIYGHRPST